MYTVVNKDTIYVAGVFPVGCFGAKEYQIREVGTENDLIKYLAHAYVELDEDLIYNHAFQKEYFDGYGRNINPLDYQNDAYIFYVEHFKHKDKTNKRYTVKNKVYHSVYRKDPVPYTGKRWDSCPSMKPRKVKHIAAMYANPEYKDFNRGSRADFPLGDWDDWSRSVERCWKSQSKSKHQWKERKKEVSIM